MGRFRKQSGSSSSNDPHPSCRNGRAAGVTSGAPRVPVGPGDARAPAPRTVPHDATRWARLARGPRGDGGGVDTTGRGCDRATDVLRVTGNVA